MTISMILHMIENRIYQLKGLAKHFKEKNDTISLALTEARIHELEALVDDIELSGYIEDIVPAFDGSEVGEL